VSQGELHPEPIVEARDLSVIYGGNKVLDVPSFQVYPNEVLVVIGPNGSGKTTLVLCLALLLEPTTGQLIYHGTPVTDGVSHLRLRRRTAVVFQEALLLNGTVWDNVTLGLRLRGIKGVEMEVRARKWLERFGVAALAKRQTRTLSGGEAKRVSLARAFALEPEVLFLDEPFSALDSPTHQAVLEEFEGVVRETKSTTVLVSHDRNEALMLADRVAVLMKGRIRQLGKPTDVFSVPVDEETAIFVQSGNVLHGIVSKHSGGLVSVNIDGQEIQASANMPVDTKVIGYLQYDDLTISLPSAEPGRTSARNQLRGRIIRALPLGSQMRVNLDCGFTLISVITRRSWEELGLAPGQEVMVSFKASSVHLIPRK
jgi:tungstate transport system ATP-binding protein